MKKTVILIFTLLLVFCFCGCSSEKEAVKEKPLAAPNHFKGLNEKTKRDDVIKLYGKPDKANSLKYSSYYCDSYDVVYLEVPGEMVFCYIEGSDKLASAKFYIDSNYFGGIREYSEAVDKTMKHFTDTLKEFIYNENQGMTFWTHKKAKYEYAVIDNEMYDYIDGEKTNIRDGKIFMLNLY